jgi:hypothetical protein
VGGSDVEIDLTVHDGGMTDAIASVGRHFSLTRRAEPGPRRVDVAPLAVACRGLPAAQCELLARCLQPLLASLPWFQNGEIRLGLTRNGVWLAICPVIRLPAENPLLEALMNVAWGDAILLPTVDPLVPPPHHKRPRARMRRPRRPRRPKGGSGGRRGL